MINYVHKYRDLEIICGALIGVEVIATIEMLGINTLDKCLTLSLFCFAVSIPALSWVAFLFIVENEESTIFATKTHTAVAFTGLFSSLVGIAAIFFHFSTPLGLVFSAASITAIIIWAAFQS